MIIFDIETGPLPEDQLRVQFDREFTAPKPPGEFDPASVKTGNLKDPAKKQAKIEEEKAKHEAAVRDHAANVEKARSESWAKFVAGAALSPLTGRVLAIGMRSCESGKIGIDGQDDEGAMLEKFWAKYSQCRASGRRMCGFNIFGFDLPFLIRRSWLLCVDVPATVFEHGRYLDGVVFVDLMQLWGCGQRDYVQLEVLTQAFGIGAKPDGVSGADFARLWATDRPAAIRYLENDLDLEAKLATKLGVIG